MHSVLTSALLTLLCGASPPDSADQAAGGVSGLRRTFSLYPRAYLDSLPATAVADSLPDARRAPQAMLSEALTVSGYKSIGICVGSNGQASLEQGLELSVDGRLGHQAHLSAHLSDQGTTLSGGTRELGEIDLMYVTLSHPRYRVTAGDQYVSWPAGGLLQERKKIKGLGAELTLPRLRVGAFGAVSGGRYAVQTIRGRDGLQGPYTLSGSGEADLITPVRGTVRLSVDGRALAEGDDGDYVVDYDAGAITFGPRFLVADERIIRVEYEYKTFDYQRSLVGMDVGHARRDSLLSVSGALWNEADNKDEPIDLTLSKDDIRLLRSAGDTSLLRLVRVPVDPRDVDSVSARRPLYELVDTAGPAFFRYAAFDPDAPRPVATLYWVPFRRVAQGSGEYVVDTATADTARPSGRLINRAPWLGPIYRYVGPGLGSITATNRLPLPVRTTQGEARLRLRLPGWVDLSADVAGLSVDSNLYSDRDDADNEGAAASAGLLLGRRDLTARSLWAEGAWRLVTRDYTREVSGAYEDEQLWHTAGYGASRSRRQSWSGGAGATLNKYLSLAGSYGQLWRDDSLLTGRLSATGRANMGSHAGLTYEGNYFHHRSGALASGQRDQLLLALDWKAVSAMLGLRDDWRRTASRGSGDVAGSAGFTLKQANWEERFTYTAHGWGQGGPASFSDTGRTLLWEQSLRLSPRPAWRLSASSSWQQRHVDGPVPDRSVVLVAAGNDVLALGGRLLTHQEYTLSSQQASALAQVPIYAGTGLGGFSYDSSRGELVPDANGAYQVQSVEVYDGDSSRTVRTSRLSATWSLRPKSTRSGLLRDLIWRGELLLLEHVLSDSTDQALSWLPGYLTLSGEDSSAVRLAHCYYEQRLSWRPDSMPGLSGELAVRPYVRRTHSGEEQGVEARLEAGRDVKRSALGLRADVKHYVFSGLSSFDVTDAGGELSQRLRFGPGIAPFVEEAGGWARKSAASGWYATLRPGVAWEGAEHGMAEASYTVANVNIPGTLDFAMARGFAGGITHRIDVRADVKLGEHFTLGGTYRGQWHKGLEAGEYEKGLHVVALEVKALL